MTETTNREIEAIYPLSPMQQGMLFHSLYAPESGVYVEQLSCTLRGDLHISAFERAWERVVERHSVLRTGFAWKRLERPLQAVHRQVGLPWTYMDWRALSPLEQERQLSAFLRADRKQGFAPARAPLMRMALVRTSDDTHQFVWSFHHLLLDGWSVPLLLREVLAFYEAHRQGQDLDLPRVRPYQDYIAWLSQQSHDSAEAYWRRALEGFRAPTPLAVDRAPSGQHADYVEQVARLPREVTAALLALGRRHHLTLHTLVQGAWALLLSRYSGEEDVVFGTTVSGRPTDLTGSESMVGLFINTLPARVQVPSDASLVPWLRELQAQQVEMRQYEHTPLVEVQGWSEVPRGLPLFESILVFENYPVAASLQGQVGSLEISNARSLEQTNYPLTVVSGPGDELVLKINYDGSRFDPDTITRMLEHLGTLLTSMAVDPTQTLGALPLLPQHERRRLLTSWNDTNAPFPHNLCLHALIEAQTDRTPHATALTSNHDALSYATLDQRANQLAHYLRHLGLKPRSLVGLCLHRSPEAIVAILATLKAGAAYLPLDPTYPHERLAFMLNDAEVSLVLSCSALQPSLPTTTARILCLDDEAPAISHQPITRPPNTASPDDPAYVIYTSGSTGQPKGILVEHRSIANLASVLPSVFRISPQSRVLQFASLSFDASVADLCMALTTGATLCLAPREAMASPDELARLLREQQITTVTLPPSVLKVLPTDDLPALETVCSAGEACPWEVVARWSPDRRFLNGYGPTEATVATSYFTASDGRGDGATAPIGRPIANARVYVLDKHLRPVPIGVPGELFIGGSILARGYLNRPELTAERFIPLPPSLLPEATALPLPAETHGDLTHHPPRLYRTGDLVRWLPDGNLEFLGRTDQQVKIRGFRIELEEVERALAQHPALREAAVVAQEDNRGERRLVAYLVLAQAPGPDVGELRHFLESRLPQYMVPSAFVALDALPRLPNGKLDRRALLELEGADLPQEEPFVAPRTPLEELLAGTFAHVLNLPHVGIHDNFFHLGGHSLLATQLLSRLRDTFHLDLPLRALFDAPTPASLANHIHSTRYQTLHLPPILPSPRTPPIPLSFAQERLWFLDQLEPDSPSYNLPTALRLHGPLDLLALHNALNEIVHRHESLRTTFPSLNGQPFQSIAPSLSIPLPLHDLSSLPPNTQESYLNRFLSSEAKRPFDLSHGPLLRAHLLRLAPDHHVAFLNFHHIVADEWSIAIFVRELAALYAAFRSGLPSPLPDLPLQYPDFALWQRHCLDSNALQPHLAYWLDQLANCPPLLNLPTDHPRPPFHSSRGAHFSFSLSPDLTSLLHDLAHQTNTTLFMTLLAAFQTLLSRYSGQSDIPVGSPIANRNHPEIEPLIGFFVNTLVLRTNLSGNPSFLDLLARVRDVTLAAYDHQDLPFDRLVEAIRPHRDLSHSPLFQVMFVLNNAPSPPLQLPDLSISPIDLDPGTARFDLTLALTENPNGLLATFEYNADLFDASTIARLASHYRSLLEAAVAHPDTPVASLPILTPHEQRLLLHHWNATTTPYPHSSCIHHRFEYHASLHPNHTALTFQNHTLSYHQLDQRANQLAHYLQSLGINHQSLVALCSDRSPDMIIAILATLKAGAAYLPLDPRYPPDRLAFMLNDAQAPLLLTQSHLLPQLPPLHARVLCLDRDTASIDQQPTNPPPNPASPDNLAYVIYTSGSTGQPKGSLLHHRGLTNLADAQRRIFSISPHDRILQFSPLSFDASVWEIFMALANGATLCLAPQDALASPPLLLQLLHQLAISIVTLPPSILAALPYHHLPHLRTIIAAGEACPADLVSRWATNRSFCNAYGPTETTVCASLAFCSPHDPTNPPIGRPIPNTLLFILDHNLLPSPIGVPGNLYVAGIPLARAYLNRPDLTTNRFIPFPHSLLPYLPPNSLPPTRLYNTGDRARFRPDGNIEFLGRSDDQIKIRGFRIEPAEIETRLSQHPLIHAAAVAPHPDPSGNPQLVAYIVPLQNATLTSHDLRSFLQQSLPDFMLPSTFIPLQQLPLTPSGKIDRHALPKPDATSLPSGIPYQPPRTPTEQTLALICADLLHLDHVGIHDHFFELGGHSLLATQFLSRIRDACHTDIPLKTLFENPTIAGLASKVDALRSEKETSDQKAAELLKRIGELSPDQVAALLQEKQTCDGVGESSV